MFQKIDPPLIHQIFKKWGDGSGKEPLCLLFHEGPVHAQCTNTIVRFDNTFFSKKIYQLEKTIPTTYFTLSYLVIYIFIDQFTDKKKRVCEKREFIFYTLLLDELHNTNFLPILLVLQCTPSPSNKHLLNRYTISKLESNVF